MSFHKEVVMQEAKIMKNIHRGCIHRARKVSDDDAINVLSSLFSSNRGVPCVSASY